MKGSRKYYLLENVADYVFTCAQGDIFQLKENPDILICISSHYVDMVRDKKGDYIYLTVYNGFMSYKPSISLYQRIYHLTASNVEQLALKFYDKVFDYEMTQKYGSNWRELDFLMVNHSS